MKLGILPQLTTQMLNTRLMARAAGTCSRSDRRRGVQVTAAEAWRARQIPRHATHVHYTWFSNTRSRNELQQSWTQELTDKPGYTQLIKTQTRSTIHPEA